MRKIGIVIQARMSSTRLPGKVLLPLAGMPMILQIINRLKRCKSSNNIIVATSKDTSDDPIEELLLSEDVELYRGSLEDVLDRYYQASLINNLDVVIRITADCPLVEPDIVDDVVEHFLEGNYDAFMVGPKFPDGLDCQVFSFESIKKAWSEARLSSEREHVGPYIENNSQLFNVGTKNYFEQESALRFTVDEEEDYWLINEIYKEFGNEGFFSVQKAITFLKSKPELMRINSHIIRNEGYKISLAKEKNEN